MVSPELLVGVGFTAVGFGEEETIRLSFAKDWFEEGRFGVEGTGGVGEEGIGGVLGLLGVGGADSVWGRLGVEEIGGVLGR